MKVKGWLGGSLVFLAALAGTVALFVYVDRMKSETISGLKNQLSEIQLERVQAEKGEQAKAAAAEAAERFRQLVDQAKTRVETVADARALRQPNQPERMRQAKIQAFQRLAQEQGWASGMLTDETGQVLAVAGEVKERPVNLRSTPAFKEASRLRVTGVQARETSSEHPFEFVITAPCLTEDGRFLGVVQAVVPVTRAMHQSLAPQPEIRLMFGNAQGLSFTTGPVSGFPKQLAALVEKNSSEEQKLKGGANFFRGHWQGTNYLIGRTPTDVPGVIVYALLEVSGVEKILGPQSGSSALLEEPVVIGGLALIAVLGLFLLGWTSGGSLSSLKRVNRELGSMLSDGGHLTPVEPLEKGEWEKLADLINLLIERAQNMKPVPPPPTALVVDEQELEALRQEAAEYHRVYQKAVEEARATQEHAEELSRELETLRASMAEQQASRRDESLDQSLHAAANVRIEAITSMSEDLKATLLVIKNYISSILASEEGKITDAQQEFLGVVINKSARLERQINDLLDISHMESEAVEMYLMPTDLVPMLQDVVLNTQPQADLKQVSLQHDIPSMLPPAWVNSDRLGQLFINLVQHALKITSVGGTVKISATETVEHLVIKVRDSGPTLTPEMVEHVFTSFHGPESPSGMGLNGTGLRFPIMRLIIDAHHGSITVRGLPEQGNEVVVTLPKKEPTAHGKTNEPFAAGVAMEINATAGAGVAEGNAEENFFDLSAFMNANESSPEGAPLSGGGEDLEELLKDIEHIEDRTENREP